MPRPHTSMRQIRDVLRLSLERGLSVRQVAASLSMPFSTVGVYLRRAKAAGLTWPLPEGLDDDALEVRLFGPTPAAATRYPEPDFAYVKRELAKKKAVTLQLLWLEYRASHPEGYS